jgi:hypothetical protein
LDGAETNSTYHRDLHTIAFRALHLGSEINEHIRRQYSSSCYDRLIPREACTLCGMLAISEQATQTKRQPTLLTSKLAARSKESFPTQFRLASKHLLAAQGPRPTKHQTSQGACSGQRTDHKLARRPSTMRSREQCRTDRADPPTNCRRKLPAATPKYPCLSNWAWKKMPWPLCESTRVDMIRLLDIGLECVGQGSLCSLPAAHVPPKWGS